MQFEDTLPVTLRYKKSLRVTFMQNSFSECIVLIRIIYFLVEKYAGNISVKSHVYALNIRRQKHEMLTVPDMVVLFINLKTSDGSEGPCCITYQSNSEFPRNSFISLEYTRIVLCHYLLTLNFYYTIISKCV
jgi:hypothetical protein